MANTNSTGVFALILLLGIGLACGINSDDKKSSANETGKRTESASLPKKLDSYEIKGVKFAYFLIPADLDRDALIKAAKEIHAKEADTQLILVDDDSRVGDYIKYVKAVSGSGDIEDPMPQEWADKHIIANVQKYMSGKWMLLESYGYKEIAEIDEK